MKLTIEATDQITELDGVPCRVLVHLIAVHNDDDSSQFERELIERLPPERIVPLSQVLP